MDIYPTNYKFCINCNTSKLTSLFYTNKTSNDGLRPYCKECTKQKVKEYQQKNTEKISIRKKQQYSKNKEIHSQKKKIYYQENKDKIKNKNKIYIEKNKDKVQTRVEQYYINNFVKKATYNKEYRDNNKDKLLSYEKLYREQHKETIKIKRNEYYLKNKEYFREYKNNYIQSRLKTDILYKLKHNTQALIRTSIINQGFSKNTKTEKILGCSYADFKKYIENQFITDMSWDNRAEWHLDHIIPISFAETEEEVIILNHYTNFRPLWSNANLIKSNKIIPDIIDTSSFVFLNIPRLQKILEEYDK